MFAHFLTDAVATCIIHPLLFTLDPVPWIAVMILVGVGTILLGIVTSLSDA